MSERYDHGPLRAYEITWCSGHIETVQGHQVLFDSAKVDLGFAGGLGIATRTDLPPRFTIHGEFEGRWRLVLTGPEADLASIRDVTDREAAPADDKATGASQ